jgi:DNA topoisomerase-3
VRHTLAELSKKFLHFTANINKMDELFEATFSSLCDTGKPLSKCGVCARFMKYIQVYSLSRRLIGPGLEYIPLATT